MIEEFITVNLATVQFHESFYSLDKKKYWKVGREHNMTEVVDKEGKLWAWPAHTPVLILKKLEKSEHS
jgi:hypothetical protein